MFSERILEKCKQAPTAYNKKLSSKDWIYVDKQTLEAQLTWFEERKWNTTD